MVELTDGAHEKCVWSEGGGGEGAYEVLDAGENGVVEITVLR